MNEVISRFGLSQRRVCRLTGWNRSSLQYQSRQANDSALRERLRHWATLKPRWGSPILRDVLKAEGMVVNHKRTERNYRDEGLSLRRKLHRKLPAIAHVPLPLATAPNQRRSMDFIHDQLADGSRFRCFTLVDDFTRQCLALRADTSIGGSSVVALLQHSPSHALCQRPSPPTPAPSSPAKRSTSGLNPPMSISITSSRAIPCRTPSSNPSTAPFATAASTGIGSALSPRPACSSSICATNTTSSALIPPSATSPQMPSL